MYSEVFAIDAFHKLVFVTYRCDVKSYKTCDVLDAESYTLPRGTDGFCQTRRVSNFYFLPEFGNLAIFPFSFLVGYTACKPLQKRKLTGMGISACLCRMCCCSMEVWG